MALELHDGLGLLLEIHCSIQPLMSPRFLLALSLGAALPLHGQGLSITNGDFSFPSLEDNELSFEVPEWYENTTASGNYSEYVYLRINHFTTQSQVGSVANRNGYIYQQVGTVPADAGTYALELDLFQRAIRVWSGLRVILFAGEPQSTGDGVDIFGDPNLTEILRHDFPRNGTGFQAPGADQVLGARTAVFDLSELDEGTPIWLRLDTPDSSGGAAAFFDNLRFVADPEDNPEIVSFTVAEGPVVEPGTTVTVAWELENAEAAVISANDAVIAEPTEATGNLSYEVGETTQFTLHVQGNGRSEQVEQWVVAREGPLPNVILFVIDDFGWADWEQTGEPTGSDLFETPSMDQLATDGIWFTEGYAAAPVCSPSRGTLLTGRSSARNLLTEWISGRGDEGEPVQEAYWVPRLELERVTVAERLNRIGYRNIHVGKWHLGERENAETFPTRQGFDINIGGTTKGNPPSGYFPEGGSFLLPELESGYSQDDYLTDVLTDKAVAEIRNAVDAEEPFFLYLSHYAVHTPIEAPEETVTRYEDKLAGLENPKQTNTTYAAMIDHMDASLGDVRAELEDLGIADNTLILLVADNGGLLRISTNEPLRGGKGLNYEGGTRTPYIAAWPGVIPENRRSPLVVGGRDITPTILDVAGLSRMLEEPDTFDGESLWPELLEPGSYNRARPLVLHYPHFSPQGGSPHSMIRDGGWKLIYTYVDEEAEVYHVAEDLSEETDLADEEAMRRADLLEKMIVELHHQKAQYPTAWDGTYLDPAQRLTIEELFTNGERHRWFDVGTDEEGDPLPSYLQQPFLYSYGLEGWFYLLPSSTMASTWLYDYDDAAWMWTNMDLHPWAYSFDSDNQGYRRLE